MQRHKEVKFQMISGGILAVCHCYIAEHGESAMCDVGGASVGFWPGHLSRILGT